MQLNSVSFYILISIQIKQNQFITTLASKFYWYSFNIIKSKEQMNLKKVNKFYRQSQRDRQLQKSPPKEGNNKINDDDKFVKLKSFLVEDSTFNTRQSILSKDQKASSCLRSSSLHCFQTRNSKPMFFGMNQKQFLDIYVHDPFARQKINYTIKRQMKNTNKNKIKGNLNNQNGGKLLYGSIRNALQQFQKIKKPQNCQENLQNLADLRRSFRRVSSLKKIEEVQQINYYQNLLRNTGLGG